MTAKIVASQTAHTKGKWPPYSTEWTNPWKFSAYATGAKQLLKRRNLPKERQLFELHHMYGHKLWGSSPLKFVFWETLILGDWLWRMICI